MKGILHKWTNYVKGWQPRYFIMENGNLSYYRSPSEVSDGCNGIVNLSVCDLVVYHNDPYRFDLNIPGKLCYYLRANSREDRQKWIIAIGCEKAGGELGCGNLKLLTSVKNDLIEKHLEMKVYNQVLLDQFKEIISVVSEEEKKTSFSKSIKSIKETSNSFLNSLNQVLCIINQLFLDETPKRKNPPAIISNNSVNNHQNSTMILNDNSITDYAARNNGKDEPLNNSETQARHYENIYFDSFDNTGKFKITPKSLLTFNRRLTMLLSIFDSANSQDDERISSEFINLMAGLRMKIGKVLISMQNVLNEFSKDNEDCLENLIDWEHAREGNKDFTEGCLYFTRIMNFLGESICLLFKGDEFSEFLSDQSKDNRDEDISILVSGVYSGTLRPFLSRNERVEALKLIRNLPTRSQLIYALLISKNKSWTEDNVRQVAANAIEFSSTLLLNVKKIDDIFIKKKIHNKIYPLYSYN